MVFIYIMPRRIDTFKIDSHHLDHDGYLRADNSMPTRAGVFTYRQADGTVRRELRHPDEVFKADSLKTIINRPITDQHPMTGKVTPDNIKHLQVGMCGDKTERTDDDHVKISLLIQDATAISKITEGKQIELSCGYHADVIASEGEYNGERYDHIQKNIIYNHVALVKKGRAGSKARIYLDADDAVSEDFEIEPQTQLTFDHITFDDKGNIMKIKRNAIKTNSFKMDAETVEFNDEAEGVVQKAFDHLDKAVDVITGLEAKVTKLDSEKEALQGKCDQLEEDKSKGIDPVKLDAMVSERADLCGLAKHLDVKDYGSMDSVVMKRAIVEKANDGLKLDDKSDDYVNARYDGVVEQIKRDNKGLESLANLAKVTQKTATHEDRKDADDKDKLSPREQFKVDSAALRAA